MFGNLFRKEVCNFKEEVMKKLLALLATAVFTVGFAQTEISYWLWDANQTPAYQACADEFAKTNPDIKVNIVQQGWGDYWTGITTGFVSGTAPDVFTNHLAKYPEFAASAQLVDIQPWVERDGVDKSIYLNGLPELWGRDGAQFGLPKDWDTIALAYNKEMIAAAGITEEEINNMTWNPEDGGTFAEIIAKLTLDANGNNALSADFDAENVVQYGFLQNGTGGAYGQTEWSWLTNTTGWTHTDGLYATKYNYDDPRFINTIQFLADLMKKGISPGIAELQGLGSMAMFQGKQGAIRAGGSWEIGDVLKADFETAFAPIPTGPEGRKSMFNGLADSIWVGSQNQEAAWEWVKFAASPTCADIVGSFAVVFPAIQSGVDATVAKRLEQGVNVAAFADLVSTEGATFLFPVTDYASQVGDIMTKAMDRIYLGEDTAANVIPAAAAEVNAVFE
jgi:multiple sugar transport system substrate-binding protein